MARYLLVTMLVPFASEAHVAANSEHLDDAGIIAQSMDVGGQTSTDILIKDNNVYVFWPGDFNEAIDVVGVAVAFSVVGSMTYQDWVPEWTAATFEDVSYWMNYSDCVVWSDLITSRVSQEDLTAFMMDHVLESEGVNMEERCSANPR